MTAYKHMNKRKCSRLFFIFLKMEILYLISYVEHPHPFVRWNDGLLKRHCISLHGMTSFSASGSPKGSYLMRCCQCSVIEHSTKPSNNQTLPPNPTWVLATSFPLQSVQMQTADVLYLCTLVVYQAKNNGMITMT